MSQHNPHSEAQLKLLVAQLQREFSRINDLPPSEARDKQLAVARQRMVQAQRALMPSQKQCAICNETFQKENFALDQFKKEHPICRTCAAIKKESKRLASPDTPGNLRCSGCGKLKDANIGFYRKERNKGDDTRRCMECIEIGRRVRDHEFQQLARAMSEKKELELQQRNEKILQLENEKQQLEARLRAVKEEIDNLESAKLDDPAPDVPWDSASSTAATRARRHNDDDDDEEGEEEEDESENLSSVGGPSTAAIDPDLLRSDAVSVGTRTQLSYFASDVSRPMSNRQPTENGENDDN